MNRREVVHLPDTLIPFPRVLRDSGKLELWWLTRTNGLVSPVAGPFPVPAEVTALLNHKEAINGTAKS